MSDTKRTIRENKQYEYSYLDKLTFIDVILCELLLDPKNAKQDSFDDLLKAYLNAWAQMKSVTRKREGIEQLEIIVTLLSYSTDKAVIKVHKGLVEVYEALSKMLK